MRLVSVCKLVAPLAVIAGVGVTGSAGCSSSNSSTGDLLGDDASNGGSSSGSPSSSSGSGGASGSGGQASSGAASSSSGSQSSGSSSGSSGGSGGSSGTGSSSGSSGAQSSGSGSSGAASSSGSSSGSSSDSAVLPDVQISGDASADSLSFQEYNLMIINMYRAGGGLAPYTLDSTLSAFALAGSQELTQDHTAHKHFMDAGQGLWTMGFNTMAGENQGDPNGWRVLSTTNPVSNEEMQIAQILAAMYAEGPGTGEAHGHYENIMSSAFVKVGVGLVEVNNSLYLTNDFSN